ELGGQLLRVYNPIENHLGVEAENGRRLRDVFIKQIEKRKFSLLLSSRLREVDLVKKTVLLETGEIFTGKSIIIATGVRRRKLNVEGEDKFKDKGIIESGKRDWQFVKNKNAAVVGGGDAAFENALILAGAAKSVTLIHRGENFRARAEFAEQVLSNPKIKVFTGTAVRKIIGDERIRTIRLENPQTAETFDLPIDALLIRVGVEPNTELFGGQINLDDNGYIKIDGCGETSNEGVFAAGDAANPIAPTVSGAVGMGATAVKAIFSQLNL
ncbi:MAG: FAD-dependent oxidoreductase, partial [Acidobacteriota bacterium]|nr:FAD-dependent oxidoreductase [Acidobacteriota bacterium]